MQKEYCGAILLGKHTHSEVMDVSHLLSAILAKKQLKITYGTRVEVDAYIHWADDPVDISFVI